jgi:Mn2+/Fe2+ NRAMP family transporter
MAKSKVNTKAIPQGLQRMQRESSRHSTAAASRVSFWHEIGPGLLAGTSGNDPSAVTAYAVDGASSGYGQLWLLLLATPLYLAVQFACAKIGRISQQGLSQLLLKYYGLPVAACASLLLAITNIALIAADLAAIGSGLQLLISLSWAWFVTPIAFLLWFLIVYQSFATFLKIFLTMSLVFIAYILAAFFSHVDWFAVLLSTFVPHISFTADGLSSAVALLGATISPYSMFWQVHSETEEQRSGSLPQQLSRVKLDVGSGAIAGQLVAYFIIICTSATLFTHHASINSAADAARVLEPLAGPLASYLFAIGLIGAGVVAIPVLLISTAYALTGIFGHPSTSSLSSARFGQSNGFHFVLTGTLLLSLLLALLMALLSINPIRLIFWANVIAGAIAPALVIFILLLGNNRAIMHGHCLNWLHNFGLLLVVALLLAATGLLVYSLL